MKKIVLLLLILIVGIKIKADNGPRPVQIDEIFYRLNSDKTATVVSDDSLDYNLAIVVIPNTVTYDDTKYTVTEIGDYAFYNNSSLLSVKIPNSVTNIGGKAFSLCTNLKNITIPNSVTYIGASAFEDTEWFDNQQDGVVYAGLVAYRYKGTMATNTNIILKEGTISVSPDFCNGRPLKYVYIPEGVKTIGSFAFSLCDDLTCISIPESVCRLEENWARNSGIKDLFIYSKKPPFVSYYGDISGKLKGMKACVLHVPVESEFLYKEDNSWNNSFKLIETFSTSHRIKEDISEDGVVDTQDILQIYDYMRTR